jgi:hypothetical protein
MTDREIEERFEQEFKRLGIAKANESDVYGLWIEADENGVAICDEFSNTTMRRESVDTVLELLSAIPTDDFFAVLPIVWNIANKYEENHA